MKNKGHEWVAFLTEWLSRNKAYLNKQMGMGVGNWYLSGILFTMLVGLQVVPHLQKVFQAVA